MIAAAVAEPLLAPELEFELAFAEGESEAGAMARERACFVAGTSVLTPTGERPIEQLKVGDEIITSDPSCDERVTQKVTRTFVRSAPAVLDIQVGEETISATPEHPFWVPGQGWVKAGNLAQGSPLVTQGGSVVRVESIARREGSFTVYNIEAATAHTYRVSRLGILVHNQCQAGGGARPVPEPNIPAKPGDSPGSDYTWRGKQPPGNPDAAWHNPKTDEYLRPHMHQSKHGPHWDYRAPDGSKWRGYPDGSWEQKP